MDNDDYIKTFNINGTEIKLGMDDYGQCYYVEWVEDGKTQEIGLGTYNSRYMEEMYYLFDPVYKKLTNKELWGEDFTPEEQETYKKYKELFDKEYSSVR